MNNNTSATTNNSPAGTQPDIGETIHKLTENIDFHNLLDNYVDENYLIVDTNLTIVKFNQGFKDFCYETTGLELNTSTSILTYVAKDQTETVQEYYHLALKGEPQDIAFNIPGFNNKFFSYNIRFKPIYDKQQQIIGVYVNCYNLSCIKKVVFDSTNHEAIYQHMIDNSLNAYFNCSLDGHIFDVNQAAADLFGYSREELLSMSRADLILNLENFNSYFNEQSQQSAQVKGETIGVRKNGEEFPIEFSTVIYSDPEGNPRTSTFIIDVSVRKNAELLAEKNERQFKALIENAGEIVMLTSAEGSIYYTNPAFEKVTGYLTDDINNNLAQINRIIHPNDLAHITEAYLYIMATPGAPRKVQYRIAHKNGNYIWLSGSIVNLLNDPNVSAIVANYRDITSKKEVQANLARSEARYKALVEKAEDIILLVQADGHITYVSPGFENQTGFSADEVIGHYEHEFVFLTEARESPVLIKQLLDTPGSSVFRTNRIKCKDGKFKWVEGYVTNLLNDENVEALVSNFHDITSRLEAEERIREYDSNLKAIFENSTEAFLLMDTNRIIKAFNKNAIKVAQLNGDKPLKLGVDFLSLAVSPRANIIEANIRKSLNGEIITYDLPFVINNGDTFWYEFSLNPVYAEGRIVGSCMTARDITARKKADEETKKREVLFRSVFENSHDMLLLFNDTGTIEFYSPSFKKSFGLLKKINNIHDILNTIHPDDRQLAIERLNLSFNSPDVPIHVSMRKRKAKGSFMIIEGTFTNMLHKPDVNVMVANFRDLTKQRQFEDQLAMFVSIVNSSEDAILSMALNKTILTWNRGAEKMFGYTIEEAIGQSTNIIIPEERRHEEIEIIDRLKHGLPIKHYETQRKKKNGDLVYISLTVSPITDAAGNIIGASKIARDISDKKKAEEIIKNNEKRFRSLLQNSNDGLSLISADGMMIEISPAGKRIIGFEENELMGINLSKFIHPDDLVQVSKAFQHVVKIPSEIYFTQYRSLTRSGTYKWLEANFQNKLNDPAIGAIVINYRDITDRKNQEIEREKLIKTLNKHNTDLRNFSYITSHNLKAPLSNLMGFLDLLNDTPIEDPTLATILGGFKTSTLQLNNTVNDLVEILIIRDKSDIEQKKLSFDKILKQVKDQLAEQIEEAGANIEANFTSASSVVFNETYLDSIFSNLLTNALKYRSFDRPLKITIATRKEKNSVVLIFADNGIGFDSARHKAKLFGLYQRFHDRPNSKGLGLYLIKSQMDSLQGTIEVESAEGVGTTFTLRFKA